MIKFVFRWAFRFLLLALVLAIGLLLLKDNIARSFAEQRIRQKTGFDTKVGAVHLALLEPRFSIDNLKLYNPPEFGGSPFFDAPEIQVEYAPGELALHKVHLKFMRLSIRELNIVENKGKTNLMEMLHSVSPSPSTIGAGRQTEGYSFVGIDLLNLSIQKIRFIDLARPKRNQEINVALENHLVRNVRSEEDLTNILLKLLFQSGVTFYVDDHRPSQTSAGRPP